MPLPPLRDRSLFPRHADGLVPKPGEISATLFAIAVLVVGLPNAANALPWSARSQLLAQAVATNGTEGEASSAIDTNTAPATEYDPTRDRLNSIQNEDVRYYQTYQSVPLSPATPAASFSVPATPVPAATSPPLEFGKPLPVAPAAATSIPIAVPTALPSTVPDALPSTVPAGTSTTASTPGEWGVVAPPPTSAGDSATMAAASPINLQPLANTSSDLVVPATSVQVVGASGELQQLILDSVQTQPGGSTSQAQLQQDVANILQTGLFADASVSATESPAGLDVTFQVRPVVAQSIRLVNAQVLPIEVANASFQSQFGAPINPTLLRQGADAINQWYTENGYTLAQVTAVRPTEDGTIAIEVAEGVVSNVVFRFVDEEGNPLDEDGEPIKGRTRESFLQRETALKPGQVFRQEAVQADMEKLAELGLFNRIDASLEGDVNQVEVVYNLSEASARGVNFGGGVSSDIGVFGTITYKDNNFNGIGQQFSTDVNVSGRGLQGGTRFTSPYRESQPNRLGYEVDVFRRRWLSDTFDDRVRLPNDDRVREGRLGGGVAVMRPVNEDWDGKLGLRFTRISIRDDDGDLSTRDELGNPLSFSGTGIDDLFALQFGVSQDRSDNPANPSRGSRTSLSTEQSIPVGSGNILMNRLRANHAQYIPVGLFSRGKPRSDNPEVIAINVQGGTVIGNLPPAEAFNLGGFDSVRGYGENDVGSGRSYVLLSSEYRFPIYKSVLGGVLFADFASDLGSGDTVLGEPAEVRDKPGTGLGLGGGLRVNSPLGLIRLDFGVSDQGESRLRFGFGQRF